MPDQSRSESKNNSAKNLHISNKTQQSRVSVSWGVFSDIHVQGSLLKFNS